MVTLWTTTGKHRAKYILIAGATLLALAIAALVFLHRYWPFTEDAVRNDLASATSSEVRFGNFHSRYFPPGCVAENVTFQQDNSAQPFIVVRRLTIESTLLGLLRHRVSVLRAVGLHGVLVLQAFRKDGFRNTANASESSNKTIIDKFVADDAVLDIPRRSQQTAEFIFHKFSVTNLNSGGVMTFNAAFENPLPRGMLRSSGKFGPWNGKNPGATAVSGEYSLDQADLSVFHSIAGNVSSQGKFSGTVSQIQVEGATHSPELMVAKTQHGLPLHTDFSAEVDASNGNVVLRQVKARFGEDEIAAAGTVARRDNGKRSAILDLTCTRGRIEDTFYPFIHSPKSPLSGDVEFQMHVVIPSGHERFLRKIELVSNFKIQNARFTKPETQSHLSKVAAPPDQQQSLVPADFEGNVRVTGGVAKFSNLSVHDDGAAAFFRGDYSLTDEKVNLHGRLKTEASLTKTTKGIKAMFAKVIEPFFKKKPHETVVPVHIGGTYSHPNFGLDIGS